MDGKRKKTAENKSCSSYNCGFCETAPLTESAKCSEPQLTTKGTTNNE